MHYGVIKCTSAYLDRQKDSVRELWVPREEPRDKLQVRGTRANAVEFSRVDEELVIGWSKIDGCLEGFEGLLVWSRVGSPS